MFSATKSFFTNEATGGLAPSWSLDFSTGSTYADLVFARSANTATYVDSSGYIAGANADVLRLTHDKNGTRLGLLVEESRTNSLQRSEEFDNAYWTKTGLLAFGSGSTANAATAPDNTTTADLITESSGGTSGHYCLKTFGTFTANTSYTWSIFVKKPSSNARDFATITFNGTGGHNLVRSFDLGDGTSTQNSLTGANFSSAAGGSEDYGNGWWRLWIRVTIGGTAVTNCSVIVATSTTKTPTLAAGAYPNQTGDGVSGILVWGAQLEANATMSSYIKTTNATATRNNDTAYILDSSITGWADPGAIVVHFYAPGVAGTILSTDDTATEQLGIEASTTTAARAFWSSGSTATSTIGTGVQKAVHYWSGTASSFCINGGTVQTGTNNIGTFGNIDFVTLGAEATVSAGVPNVYSQFSNLIIRKVEFYAGTLTSGNLQTITT